LALTALTVTAGGLLAGFIFALCTINPVPWQFAAAAINPGAETKAQRPWICCLPIQEMWGLNRGRT
jgi:hypothetical protein